LALDPLVNRRGSESPEFADMNPSDLASQNHPLQCSGVNTKQCSGGVTVEQRLHTWPPQNWEKAL
jgi:hypothetical protein